MDNNIVFDDSAYGAFIKEPVKTRTSHNLMRSGRMPMPELMSAALDAADRRPAFVKIEFYTEHFMPNHEILLKVLGDSAIIRRGTFGRALEWEAPHWTFLIDKDSFAKSLQFTFLVDGLHEARTGNISIDGGQTEPYRYSDNSQVFSWVTTPQVNFPSGITSRYRHGIENLRQDRSIQQEERFPGNHNEDIEYDVIVIGSGMGGGVVAETMADKGLRTLVLDVGSFESPTHLSNIYIDWSDLPGRHQTRHFKSVGEGNFLFGAQMALGGRSLYWSGIILRMQEWEYGFWPKAVADYLKNNDFSGYRRAEALMRKGRTLGDFQNAVVCRLKERLPDLQIEDLPRSLHQPFVDGEDVSVQFASTGVFSTADILADSTAFRVNGDFFQQRGGTEHLTINLNHLVTAIEPASPGSSKARSVVCQDLVTNTQRRYKGKCIVLAAGSVQSPIILQKSKLDHLQGKVGIGLTDHPYGRCANYEIPETSWLYGHRHHAKLLLAAPDSREDHYPFLVEVLINPMYWHLRYADDDIWNSVPAKEKRTVLSMKFGLGSRLNDGNNIHAPEIGQPEVYNHRMSVHPNAPEQARQFRNRILEALEIPHDPHQSVRFDDHGGTVHHAGGTLRMGSGPDAVVNENLKFYGYDNLYAADCSVFPYIPSANPSLTLVALCQRLSDYLGSQLLPVAGAQ
jgi:hypothetical protein